ncbi:MAG TPA: hypothetical protein VFM71_11300 [Gemmatimonadaceae bacterium]|nr:hypothetical protein [Gemmatimonadaceae bacterium]
MLTRLITLTAVLVALAHPHAVAEAQALRALDDEALAAIREDVLLQRYDQAIRRANDVLGSARAMTLRQRVELWQMMAAAYYPPDAAAQKQDSALLQIDALVRVAPDATLPAELSWPGLDTLVEKARAFVFSVTSRPPPELVLRGASQAGFITVVASRPTRFRLTTVSRATGVAVVQDSTGLVTEAQLRLRAHNGRSPLIESGDYRIVIVARDGRTADSTVIVHDAVAVASDLPGPIRVPRFVPPTTTTRSTARMGRALALGIGFAGATFAIAREARPPGTIRSGFGTDQRALVVGAVMVGAAVASLFLDDEAARPADAATIERARRDYDRRVSRAAADSRERLADYRVVLRIEPEGL